MDSFQLKPCPACGASVRITGGDEWYNRHEFWICCENKECGCVRVGDTEREECIRRWNALPRALNWTKEPPTKEGWYWLKWPGGSVEVVRLVEHLGVDFTVCYHYSVYTERLSDLDKRIMWAGPLQEPHGVEDE